MVAQNFVMLKEGAEENILKSPYSPIPFIDPGTTSAAQFLLNKAEENARKGYTHWLTNSVTGEEMNFGDLEPLSRKAASAMHKRGMRKGAVALYLTTDVTRIYAVVVGAWRTGAIMYSSYPDDSADTLLQRLQETNAAWIFCDPISLPQCREAIAQVDWPVEIFTFREAEGTTLVDELFLDDGEECPENIENSGPDDPILVLCTSGTTGVSKGVVYTNRAILRYTYGTSRIMRTERPMMLLTRCMDLTGIFFCLRAVVHSLWFVCMHQASKQNIYNCVQNYKPIYAFGYPTFMRLLTDAPEAANYDLSSLEAICTGGAVITENFYKAMRTLPNVNVVMNGYGLTENGTISTTIDLGGHAEHRTLPNQPPLTVGKLMPDTYLKVIDLDTGRNLGPLELGQLLIKSSVMASGYWNRPAETAAAFVDGWLKTGDLGYYDENGFIFVVDRIKETFKYYSHHISPAEIEPEILKHPKVAETTVFGVLDSATGQYVPRALVVLKRGETGSPAEIQNFANERLLEHTQLRGGLYVVDCIPRGKTGKILRSAAAKLIQPLIL